MKTSGLVLDVYDDFRGEVLRSVFPSQSDIPDMIKQAHALSSEERAALPDDAFALVLVNNGETMRKFACTDAGNTALSVEYLLRTVHKLPEEAQKVAATNLLTACDWYSIIPPEPLQKIAFLGAMMSALPAIETAAAVPGQVRQKLDENKVLGQGGRVVTDSDRAAFRSQMGKTAEVTGTVDMPLSAQSGQSPTPSKTVIRKTGSQTIGRLVPGHHGKENCPDDNLNMEHGKQPPSEPQSKALRPHVDVSNKEPPKVLTEKKAERYALPSAGKYPLDSYTQVQAAVTYFDKYASMMPPEDRREYCVNLVKRAGELSIPVSNLAYQYGAEGYAPEEQLKVAYEIRRKFVSDDPEVLSVLDGLYEKRASIDPELFALTLGEFDKVSGLVFQQIPDHFISTFGEKVAAEWSEVIGNDMVTEQDLRRLSKIGVRALKSTFSEDFAMEFRKNPVDIFKSLPLDQKKLIMRMAVDNSGPGIELTA